MIDRRLDGMCQEIREELGCAATPVDVLKIAAAERIEIAPGTYGESFHGRIEFIPSERRFALYYPDLSCGVPPVRLRFSLAHELGHYYLPSHREALLRGEAHDSVTEFVCDRQREREADEFAACLLVPTKVMERQIGARGFLDMRGVVGTERWITAADLDAAGEYRFRMIRPNSVEVSTCHTIIMYQDGVNLGEAYYSGVLMPEE